MSVSSGAVWVCGVGRCETHLTQEAGGQLTMNKAQAFSSDSEKDSSSHRDALVKWK